MFDIVYIGTWMETVALGVVTGIWMVISALTAWLLLGH